MSALVSGYQLTDSTADLSEPIQIRKRFGLGSLFEWAKVGDGCYLDWTSSFISNYPYVNTIESLNIICRGLKTFWFPSTCTFSWTAARRGRLYVLGQRGSSGHFWKSSRMHYENQHFGCKTFKLCALQVRLRQLTRSLFVCLWTIQSTWGFGIFILQIRCHYPCADLTFSMYLKKSETAIKCNKISLKSTIRSKRNWFNCLSHRFRKKKPQGAAQLAIII